MAEQAQYSVTEQLYELVDVANREGLYDAADWLLRRLESSQYQQEELFRATLNTWRRS